MIDFKANHFELFGLPIAFDVSESGLSESYLSLQKRVHPDRYANKSATDQRIAVQASALINTAYQTLKSPLLRAEYMLELNGIDTANEMDTKMDMDFLMLQMQWRESLDGVDVSDVDHALSDLDALSDQVTERSATTLTRIKASIDGQDWLSARDATRELQFIERMKDEIRTKLSLIDG